MNILLFFRLIKAVIKYAYTGILELNEDNATSLLILSRCLRSRRLEELCANYLAKRWVCSS